MAKKNLNCVIPLHALFLFLCTRFYRVPMINSDINLLLQQTCRFKANLGL